MTDGAPFGVTTLRLLGSSTTAQDESMGSKRKSWLRIEGRTQPWLFKYARESSGRIVGEHWSEVLAAALAELIEVPAARVELATLDGQWGSLSESFLTGTQYLLHGNSLLAGHDQTYRLDSDRSEPQHTADRIMGALAWAAGETNGREVLRQFAGLLVLDALILNTDRHHENWGLVTAAESTGTPPLRLAPAYDLASSLARNEPPDRCAAWLADRALDRAAWYARRARGAIWLPGGGAHGPSPLTLVESLVASDPELFRPWLDRVRQVPPSAIAALAQRIPSDILDVRVRDFVVALVQFTTRTLANLT